MAQQRFSRWRSQLPLFVVLASLFLLITVPVLIQRRTNEVRRRIIEDVNPARELASEFQVRLGLEAAGTRGYLFTGDRRYAESAQHARMARKQAYARLVPLATRLGPDAERLVTKLGVPLAQADVYLDSLYGGRMSRAEYRRYLPAQQVRFLEIVGTSQELRESLDRTLLAHRAEIDAEQAFGARLTIALALLATIAVLLVVQLGRSYRLLAERFETRATLQRQLTEAARTLGTLDRMDEVNRVVIENATAQGRASGAYIEKIRDGDSPETVEVVAAGGTVTPTRGTRAPYPDSASAKLIESNETSLMFYAREDGSRIPYLEDSCRQCSGLIVPLYSEQKVFGALVLLRTRELERFTNEEAWYVRILGEIASSAGRRVLALEQEREAHTQIKEILERITDAFYALDRESRFMYMNHEAERLLQRSRDEVIGRIIWDAFPDVCGTILDHEYHRAMREQVTVQFESYYEPLKIWVDVRAYPSPKGLSVFFRDITGRVRIAAERERLLQREREARVEAEQRREELDRATQSRARLIRGFSHDLKNPLGAADGYLQLLEQGIIDSLTDNQKKSVARVRASIEAALDLINDLLALERAKAGELEIEREAVDVVQMTAAVVEEFRAQADAKGLVLVMECEADIPAITSDPTRIRQVIGNLLSNAVKYTQHGSVTVTIRTEDNKNAPGPARWIAVAVRDTGPGIPREQQQLVFEEFRRLKSSRQPGTGLGLAMSRSIARALGGEVTLESEPGAGSLFTFRLPVQ